MSKIAVIGAGALGSALITGLLGRQVVVPKEIMASDVRQEALTPLWERHGVRIARNNKEAAAWGDVVVISVKPHQVAGVLEEIAPEVNPEKVVVSVAAGITLSFVEARLPEGVPVVRAMPNVPALVGAGMTVLAPGRHAGPEAQKKVEALFAAVGRVITLSEEALDAVTALSGSGPAYVCVFLEALIDGGVRMGLTRNVAFELAVQTLLGTAKMVQETGIHPALLKDQVTSPGGTTITGLHVLEAGGLRGLVMDAVLAAARRAEELRG